MANHHRAQPPECFAFVWQRREKGPGFRWEPDQHNRCLLVGPAHESLVSYEPLVQETGLFLTFAQLENTPAAFLGFADKYGRLGTYHTFGPLHDEPLDEWQRHHCWMKFLAELRNACVLNKRRRLAKHVRWEGNALVYSFPGIGTESAETWRHRGQLRQTLQNKVGLPLFEADDLEGPALWFICYAIEDWLKELDHQGKPVSPRMLWSEHEHRPRLVFGPSSLLGAMVCQFAAALHGAWPFTECACCHKFFRLAPGVNRANRLTCSHTCKQYLHNRRVERARKMHATGWTVREIVKELHVKARGEKSSIEIVKRWIERE